jgi:hypothetical protein
VTSDHDPAVRRIHADRIEGFAGFLEMAASRGRLAVVGRGKSGTTWLAKILNTHPDVVMKGERKLLERNGDYEPLLAPFAIGDHVERWFDFTALRREMAVDGLGMEMARIIHDYLLSLTVDKEQFTHFGDKIPFSRAEDVDPSLAALAGMFPGIRLVHIVRDGRDVAVSVLFHMYRNHSARGTLPDLVERVDARLDGGDGRVFTDDLLARLATGWVEVVRAVEESGPRHHGDSFLRLTYEGLKADTPGTIARLFDHVGVRNEPLLVQRAIDRSSFEKVTAGRKAGDEDPSSFFRKGISGDWVNYFTQPDRELFADLAGDVLVEQGYEASARGWV